jgi:predicted kinase
MIRASHTLESGIHLICGSTGAGKTTYSIKLADDIGGVRFSIDEWMTALFWMDTPRPLDPAWSMERVERCNAQIWLTAEQIAQRGIPCILDLGLGQAHVRARFAELAKRAALGVRLHVLDVPADVRWSRVQARNTDGTHQLDFAVTREMFEFVETMFERPTDEEIARLNGIRV